MANIEPPNHILVSCIATICTVAGSRVSLSYCSRTGFYLCQQVRDFVIVHVYLFTEKEKEYVAVDTHCIKFSSL